MSTALRTLLHFFSNHPSQYFFALLLFLPCLKRRSHFALRFSISVIAYLAVVYATFYTGLMSILVIDRVMMNFIILYLISIIMLCVCFKVKVLESLYYSSAAYCMQHCVFSLSIVTLSFFEYDAQNRSIYWFFISIVINLVLYAVFYFLFVRRQKKRDSLQIKNTSLIVFSVFTMCIVYVLSSWLMFYGEDGVPQRLLTFSCSFLLLLIQFGLFERGRLQKQNEIMHQILHIEKKHQQISKGNADYLNIRLHDLKHQITSLFNAENSGRKNETIRKLEDSLSIYDSNMKTGNESLDIVLTEKSLHCKRAGINLICIADGSKLNFMSPEDIYSLFGNALSNAIESVSALGDNDKKFIWLKISTKGSILSVHTENYYEHKLSFENGIPLTTKKDKAFHGYGMESIKYIVGKYGGTMSVTTEDNFFNLNIIFSI